MAVPGESAKGQRLRQSQHCTGDEHQAFKFADDLYNDLLVTVYNESSDVESAPNEVLVSGPDGLAVSMTPEAAFETGMKLIDAAAAAKGDAAIEVDLKRRRARQEEGMRPRPRAA